MDSSSFFYQANYQPSYATIGTDGMMIGNNGNNAIINSNPNVNLSAVKAEDEDWLASCVTLNTPDINPDFFNYGFFANEKVTDLKPILFDSDFGTFSSSASCSSSSSAIPAAVGDNCMSAINGGGNGSSSAMIGNPQTMLNNIIAADDEHSIRARAASTGSSIHSSSSSSSSSSSNDYSSPHRLESATININSPEMMPVSPNKVCPQFDSISSAVAYLGYEEDELISGDNNNAFGSASYIDSSDAYETAANNAYDNTACTLSSSSTSSTSSSPSSSSSSSAALTSTTLSSASTSLSLPHSRSSSISSSSSSGAGNLNQSATSNLSESITFLNDFTSMTNEISAETSIDGNGTIELLPTTVYTDANGIISLVANSSRLVACSSPANSISSHYSTDSTVHHQHHHQHQQQSQGKTFINLDNVQLLPSQIKQEPIDHYQPTVIHEFEYSPPQQQQMQSCNDYYQFSTATTTPAATRTTPETRITAISVSTNLQNSMSQQQQRQSIPTTSTTTVAVGRKRNANAAFDGSSNSNLAPTSGPSTSAGGTTTTTTTTGGSKKPRMTKREKQKMMDSEISRFEIENRDLRQSINLLEQQIAFCKQFLSKNVAPVIQQQQQRGNNNCNNQIHAQQQHHLIGVGGSPAMIVEL